MRVFSTAMLMPLALVFSTHNEALASDGYIYNRGLLTAYENFDEAIEADRSELEFSEGKFVKNCSAYLSSLSKAGIAESTYNYVIKAQYVICDALRLLSQKSVVFVEDPGELGRKLLSRLDFRTFGSSIGPRTTETKYTLIALFPESISSNGPTAIYEDDEWYFGLEVVAAVELNGNDTLDWIIWNVDDAKGGTYYSYDNLRSGR